MSHLRRWWSEWVMSALFLAFGILTLIEGNWVLGVFAIGAGLSIATMPTNHWWLTRRE